MSCFFSAQHDQASMVMRLQCCTPARRTRTCAQNECVHGKERGFKSSALNASMQMLHVNDSWIASRRLWAAILMQAVQLFSFCLAAFSDDRSARGARAV